MTFICSSDLKSRFSVLVSPRSDQKLVLLFNTSLGFTLPSLKFLNNYLKTKLSGLIHFSKVFNSEVLCSTGLLSKVVLLKWYAI